MKIIFIIFNFLLIITVNLNAQPQMMWQVLTDGTIIKWAYSGGDEFNGNSLDESKWLNSFPWGRNYNGPSINQEYMTDGNNIEFGYNSSVNSGTLRFIAKNEDVYARGVPYEADNFKLKDNSDNLQTWHKTSGMIFSKQAYKNGLFEIGAKWPSGKGAFPAFWLFGGNPNEEFDIIEYKGETPNRYHIDVHCPNGNCDNYGDWIPLNGNLSNSFEVIRGEWDNNACYFSINNTEFAIWLGTFNYQANIIANFSIAGPNAAFLPAADGTTPYPETFEIDFIRVWTRIDCDQDITICNYNQTITDPTVKTGRDITLSGTGCQSLLQSGKSLDLIATNKIDLKPGFHAEEGSKFSAKIISCVNPNKSINDNDSSMQVIQPLLSKKNYRESSLSSINKTKLEPSFYTKITPNPTNGKINIEFEGSIDRKIKIELYNSVGGIVFSKDINTIEKIEIDISNLSKGVYFLKGNFGLKSISEKIILN